MWILQIIEGGRFNGGHPLLFLEIFLHDLILPPGGIKSEFIMREILIGRKSKSKVQVKRIKCSFSSRL